MYRVERRTEEDGWSALTEEPVVGATWVDATATQERAWTYRIRAVSTVDGGGMVLGLPCAPLTVEFPDIYPPPAPRELICLPEGSRVRLRWAAVAEAVRYRVERRAGNRPERRLTDDITVPAFVDERPPVGRLAYEVRAVDAVGNESEPTSCEAVIGTVAGDESP